MENQKWYVVIEWDATTNTINEHIGPWGSGEDAIAFIEGLPEENFETKRYTIEEMVSYQEAHSAH